MPVIVNDTLCKKTPLLGQSFSLQPHTHLCIGKEGRRPLLRMEWILPFLYHQKFRHLKKKGFKIWPTLQFPSIFYIGAAQSPVSSLWYFSTAKFSLLNLLIFSLSEFYMCAKHTHTHRENKLSIFFHVDEERDQWEIRCYNDGSYRNS